MLRLFFVLAFVFAVVVGCNTTNSNVAVTTSIGTDDELKLKGAPPSEVAEDGLCMADTLNFLVGQPETALGAMKYPKNTRILVHGQVVNLGIDSTRLNLVLGLDRNIRFVYCG